MIKSTAAACKASGMPLSHAACFQRIANQTNCVVTSRSVGEFATGLIMESYASKGFHVKSKSCNWGPMAGFVLSDPRFTKTGSEREAMQTQRTEVGKAIKGGATEVPVVISDDRRKEVESKGWMTRAGGNINEMIYSASSKGGKTMNFVLRREIDYPGAGGKQLWSVHYGAAEKSMPSSPTAPNRGGGGAALQPVMALCNPGASEGFRSALTGDYDLWAVFPPANNQFSKAAQDAAAAKFPTHGQMHNPKGADQRMVKGSERFPMPIKAYIQQEDAHMGNMTARISKVKDMLNGAIAGAGYKGGMMVHHSDEVGRPMVNSVELEYIAFIPGQKEARFIKTLADMKQFLAEVMIGYHITFNPGWQRQFGFTATNKGSFEV